MPDPAPSRPESGAPSGGAPPDAPPWGGPGPRGAGGGGPARALGGQRNRELYDRRRRRQSEHASLRHRAMRAVMAVPEPLAVRLAGPDRVEVDGRVLDRRVQFMLALQRLLPAPLDATRLDPSAQRRQLRMVAIPAMPTRRDVYSVDRLVPRGSADGGPVPVRVYRPYGAGTLGREPGRGGRRGAVVYLHGGGWASGDLDTHHGSCQTLAAVTGCVVVAVDYRLAPEHPFPAALDDALAAWRWVHQRPGELGFDPGRVGVMGDSAGGNLAAALALVARDSGDPGLPLPHAQGLVYPAVDARLATESIRTLSDGFMLTADAMRAFREAYVPDPADWERPEVSPLLAADHAGLPRALVVTAGFDPLRDDGTAYAAALRSAGVEVHERCYDGQIHGFFGMGLLPGGMEIVTEVCEAMGRLMARPVPSRDA